jgi:hypothetical protein
MILPYNNFILETKQKSVIAYHGTYSDFDKFIPQSDNTDSIPKAIYFTNNIRLAKKYGNKIIKVKLNIKNPLIVNMDFANYHTDYGYNKYIEYIKQAYNEKI